MKKAQKTIKKQSYKTSWDLSGLYNGPEDKKIEYDVVLIEKAYKKFADKYSKNDSFLDDESSLLEALIDYEKMLAVTETARPIWYLKNLSSIDSQNKKVQASIAKFEPRVISAYNNILFFNIKLGKISKENQRKFINSEKLKKYRYFLKDIFDNSKYDLSEDAEKVLNLKSTTSYTMWVDGFKKLISKQTIKFKKNGKMQDIPLGQAMTFMHQLPTNERRLMHNQCMEALKSISYFAENEINAVVVNKKIDDELRGYERPYSSTVLGYQNDIKNIELLINTVTKNFSISNRFYKIKAKILKLKNLSYADRVIGIKNNPKKVKFDEAVEIVSSAFSKAGKYYSDLFMSMLNKGQIDVYSKVGKSGGAYCWGGSSVPTLVMLNFDESEDAVMTLAHEMGHAIHTELSKKPSIIYQHYTISVAEVASTFFENLAFDEMFNRMSDEEKITALFNRLADKVQTIFRQIACFNMENELHEEIRKKGMLSIEEMGKIHNKHMKAYLGDVFKMTDLDGYFLLYWSHIRSFFYVYSYAYGEIISQALYKKCKEDNGYFEKINKFMEAGATMSPDDIFKSIGIDTSDPEFYSLGLKSISDDLDKLESLIKKSW